MEKPLANTIASGMQIGPYDMPYGVEFLGDKGVIVAFYAHMGNIEVRSKAYKLEWDEANARFTEGAKANSYIKPLYRKSWVFPDY